MAPAEPSPDLEAALEALQAGAVIAMPTDTVYGLAADPRVAGASERIFELKGRPSDLALPVLVPDAATARELAGVLPPAAEDLVARWWPGPLTLVVRRNAAVRLALGGDPGTIGLRSPDHPVALELLRRAGALAVTSANLHGEPELHSAAEVRAVFGDRLAAVVDGGRCEGTPSTVVSCLGSGVELLRAGAVPYDELLRRSQ